MNLYIIKVFPTIIRIMAALLASNQNLVGRVYKISAIPHNYGRIIIKQYSTFLKVLSVTK